MTCGGVYLRQHRQPSRTSSKTSKPITFNVKRPKYDRQGFCPQGCPAVELYSAREIALAAGVSVDQVEKALREGSVRLASAFVPHDEAVRIGRMLARRPAGPWTSRQTRAALFASIGDARGSRRALAPLVLSSSVHAGLAALFVFLAGLNFAPRAAALRIDDKPSELMRMVFLATPGPGGGGGGGGLQ